MSIYLQYQNSTKMIEYLQALANNIRVSAVEFYQNFFNINTCGSDGLNNWGLILNQSRTVYIPAPEDLLLHKFGFSQGSDPSPQGSYPQNFYNSNFFSQLGATPYELSDNQYRQLLLFIYLNSVTNATLQTINANINYYYNPDGTNGQQIAVTNTAPMQITYNFNFTPQAYEIILFNNQGVLPTPICVEQILIYPTP